MSEAQICNAHSSESDRQKLVATALFLSQTEQTLLAQPKDLSTGRVNR